MGDLIEKILLKVYPDLEITVKGSDLDMTELAGMVIRGLRKKGIVPNVEYVPSEAMRTLPCVKNKDKDK